MPLPAIHHGQPFVRPRKALRFFSPPNRWDAVHRPGKRQWARAPSETRQGLLGSMVPEEPRDPKRPGTGAGLGWLLAWVFLTADLHFLKSEPRTDSWKEADQEITIADLKPTQSFLASLIARWSVSLHVFFLATLVARLIGCNLPFHGIPKIYWLVVSTHLKNMKVSWDDHSQYMEKKNVPNHQPDLVMPFFYVWFVAPLLSSCWRGLSLPWPNSRDCPTNGVEMGGVPQITRYGQYSSEHDCPSRLDFRPTFQILPSELLKLIGVCTP